MSNFSLFRLSPLEVYILKKHNNILEINILNGFKHPNLLASNGIHIDKQDIFSKLDIADYPLEVFSLKNNLNTFSKVIYSNHILEGLNFLHSNNISHNNLKISCIMVSENVAKIADFSKASYEKDFILRYSDIYDFGILFNTLIDKKNPNEYINRIQDNILKDLIKNFNSQIFVDPTVRRRTEVLLKHDLFNSCKSPDVQESKKDLGLFKNHRLYLKMLYTMYMGFFEKNNSVINSHIFFCSSNILYRLGRFEKEFLTEESLHKLCITLIYICGEIFGSIPELEVFLETTNYLFSIDNLDFVSEYKRKIITLLDGDIFDMKLFYNNKNTIESCISSVILNADSNVYIQQ